VSGPPDSLSATSLTSRLCRGVMQDALAGLAATLPWPTSGRAKQPWPNSLPSPSIEPCAPGVLVSLRIQLTGREADLLHPF
jgi:hypothetical protein